MKKTLKISIVFCLLLSGLVAVWAKTNETSPTIISVVTETRSKLYTSNCARCHGANGKGHTQLGQEMGVPDLTTSTISNAEIKRIILDGDGDMPAFKKKLTAAQINSLVNEVKAFR